MENVINLVPKEDNSPTLSELFTMLAEETKEEYEGYDCAVVIIHNQDTDETIIKANRLSKLGILGLIELSSNLTREFLYDQEFDLE